MNQRQNVSIENIGKHILYDQRRFCNVHCVQMWIQRFPAYKNNKKPICAPIADYNEPKWIHERKIHRAPRPKNRFLSAV